MTVPGTHKPGAVVLRWGVLRARPTPPHIRYRRTVARPATRVKPVGESIRSTGQVYGASLTSVREVGSRRRVLRCDLTRFGEKEERRLEPSGGPKRPLGKAEADAGCASDAHRPGGVLVGVE